MNRRPQRGFTLIELLVVIAIIALLVAMLLPAVQQVREAARKTQCKDHLHNLGIALHNYEGSFGRFPPGWVGATGMHDMFGNNGFAWGAMLLPFCEQKNIYDQLDLERSIIDPVNLPVIKTPIDLFRCPSDAKQPELWDIEEEANPGTVIATLASANYVGVFGTGPDQPGGQELEDCELEYETNGPGSQCRGNGLFFHNSNVRMADITDGTASTLAIGERLTIPWGTTDRHHSTWSGVVPEGEEAMARILGLTDHTVNSNNAGAMPHLDDFSSRHPGGGHFVSGDGHVLFVSENMNHDVYQWLSTISGGEVAPLP